jgi:hypothetical protein
MTLESYMKLASMKPDPLAHAIRTALYGRFWF